MLKQVLVTTSLWMVVLYTCKLMSSVKTKQHEKREKNISRENRMLQNQS
jgi:hypothetical protein